MRLVSLWELNAKPSKFFRLAAQGETVLIATRGKPTAVLRAIGEEELEDHILENSPRIKRLVAEGGGIAAPVASRRSRRTWRGCGYDGNPGRPYKYKTLCLTRSRPNCAAPVRQATGPVAPRPLCSHTLRVPSRGARVGRYPEPPSRWIRP
jgi:antitoxin (DNA-binding transcriptional repressor) of toxin-antitoxin stability system